MINEFKYGQTWKIWPSPLSLSLYSTFQPFTEISWKIGALIINSDMFIVPHRDCDAIVEGRIGEEVKSKHPFFKTIL